MQKAEPSGFEAPQTGHSILFIFETYYKNFMVMAEIAILNNNCLAVWHINFDGLDR